MTTCIKPKLAVIGAGLIGPRHARTVAESNGADLIAIVDPMSAGQRLAEELGVAYYKSTAELLQSPDKPDAAIICTPNHTHVPVAKELSTAGVHVLVEKPFCTDIPSGKELLEHLDITGVKALVGHHRRFNPYMVTAKHLVSSGSLGNIIAINGLWTTYKPLDYFDPPAEWRRHETGGVVLINMIHEVDLLHYLFGPIVRVHAERTISQRGFEAEEGAALTLRFKSGVVGSFVVSDNLPSPYNFESGTGENPLIPKAGQDCYRIFGTEASLSVPDMTRWSYTSTEKTWHEELFREKISVPEGTPFELQLKHFVKVIRGEEFPSCTGQSGLAALVVCQAIKDALEANTTVDIEALNF
ncbi:hypothetical protein TPAR_04856 [Tolypocladium paradoxum]|uniref:Oxidoreductase n=1 Tax=Tolypocladium paradoxum TaxID=94208 RepID=A0A2S4KXS0_9HYPO|nr:hypothetical protein TPAR_04856 [Tolypocladium paradoxum]